MTIPFWQCLAVAFFLEGVGIALYWAVELGLWLDFTIWAHYEFREDKTE